MKCKFTKNTKNEKGLTLVELLAVIVILGIIAAIAIPAIGKIIENSQIKAVKSEAIIAIDASKLYFLEHDISENYGTATIPNLITEGYMSDNGYLNPSSYVINTQPLTICAAAMPTVKGKASNVKFVNASSEMIAKSKNKIQVGVFGDKCGTLEVTID